MPEARWPRATDGELEVVYRFAADEPRVLRIPASDGELTVLWVESEPAAVAERFVDGQRLWIAPDDAGEVRVRCGYRLFGDGGARLPAGVAARVLERFPGAEVIGHRDLR